jgi:hypothetical protein
VGSNNLWVLLLSVWRLPPVPSPVLTLEPNINTIIIVNIFSAAVDHQRPRKYVDHNDGGDGLDFLLAGSG